MTTLRLPFVSLPKRDLAVDLRDDGVVLRLARLEQLGHARETARDVLRLRGLARNLRETSPASSTSPSWTTMFAPTGRR